MSSRGVPLDPAEPAAVGLARLLAAELAVVRRNAPGIVADDDIEHLHDWRVAIRRSRSLLTAADGVLDDAVVARFAPELRRLIRRTGDLRDLDVWLDDLDDMVAGLHDDHRVDVEVLRAFLQGRRAEERRHVVKLLGAKRYRRTVRDWEAQLTVLGSTGPEHPPGAGGPTMAELARSAPAAAFERFAGIGATLTSPAPDATVHELRKRAKDLRYQLESFADLLTDAGPVIDALRRLQDVLGAFQDDTVRLGDIARFADELSESTRTHHGVTPHRTGSHRTGSHGDAHAAAGAILELGELRAMLEARHEQARAEVVGAVVDFTGSDRRRWFEGLAAT